MAKIPLYVITISLVVGLGSFEFGFGSAVFVASLGQPGFYMYYGLDPTAKHTADIISAVNGLFYFGAAMGSLSQSWFADRWGRRVALAVAAIIALIGSALVAGSVNIPMLCVVRVLQGCGLGMLLTLVPLYLSEVAPPAQRGLLTGLSVLSFGLGYVTCSWMSVGCYFASNLTLSWRLPLALACVPPFPLLFGLRFVPESPRYLAWRGKLEEAWAVVQKLHKDKDDPNQEIAQAEFTQIVRQVEAEKEDQATFITMFKKPSWRKRSLLAFFITFAAQAAGIYGITNYLPVIFASLGMTGSMPLIMYASHTTVGTLAVLLSIVIVDKFGRRRLIFVGYISLTLILLAEGLLQWKYVGTDDKAGNAACVLFIFLYIIFFQCVDAPAFIWIAEAFPTHLRAKGVSLGIFALFVGTITFSTPAPVAFSTIGWRMFMIYMALSAISAVITYLYLPETKGLPIEEIGALFGDEVVVHLTQDGHGLVEDKSIQVDHREIASESATAAEKV
ncbi:hypothetical protein B0A52_03159 [Exophiala mesophila]|uniref:Major facilitator superfamily (MFS) profile domain-containing protein n=1 Tax=Exophiala mesophila TaxID=212818 RepID=A0A438NAZ8_EXOME|nr:hypothetical protein B0A52_03159 [Exophiala mesophila]